MIDALPIPAAWSITDATGVSAQTISLVSAEGAVLWSQQLQPDVRQMDVSEDQHPFANFTGYTLRLYAIMGSGLTITFERSFSTDWAGPAEPVVTVSYGEDLAGSIMVADGEEEGAPDAVSFAVTRVVDGETWQVATGLLNGQTARDPLPPLNYAYQYIVTAYAESGAITQKVVDALCDSGGMEAFNYLADASAALVLGLDASSRMSSARSGETFHFALGPDAPHLPTFYADGDMDITGSKSYVVYGAEGYREVARVARDPSISVFWYRDAWGGRSMVKADFSLSYDAKSYMRFDVSASVTEVVWEDPL